MLKYTTKKSVKRNDAIIVMIYALKDLITKILVTVIRRRENAATGINFLPYLLAYFPTKNVKMALPTLANFPQYQELSKNQ